MNETIKSQLNHSSVREFVNEQIEYSVLDTIIKAGQQGATAHFRQAYSIIKIENQQIKDEIAKICTQEFVANIPCLLIMVVDLYPQYQLAIEHSKSYEILSKSHRFLTAYSDTMILTQNMVVASESLGYGTILLASITNDTKKLIDLLKLPKYTFPIIGMGIGKYENKSAIKPRIPTKNILHLNTYQASSNKQADLAEYDEQVAEYYKSRTTNTRVETFSSLLVDGLDEDPTKRNDLFTNIQEQGLLKK